MKRSERERERKVTSLCFNERSLDQHSRAYGISPPFPVILVKQTLIFTICHRPLGEYREISSNLNTSLALVADVPESFVDQITGLASFLHLQSDEKRSERGSDTEVKVREHVTVNDKVKFTRREKLLPLLAFDKQQSWKIPKRFSFLLSWIFLHASRRTFLFVPLIEMRVFLKNLDGKICSVEIEPSDEIASVMAKIEEKTGINPANQRLIHAGHKMAEGLKVSDYNIQEGATINIIHRGPLALLPDK